MGVLTSDFDIKHIVCFAFNIVSHSTAYTDVLEDFLATEKKNTKSTKEWFDNAAISAEMRSKSSTFIDFVHTNSGKKDFRFAVTDTKKLFCFSLVWVIIKLLASYFIVCLFGYLCDELLLVNQANNMV